jgi:hypothetical protein
MIDMHRATLAFNIEDKVDESVETEPAEFQKLSLIAR